MEVFLLRFFVYGFLFVRSLWYVTDGGFRGPRATPAATLPLIPDVNNIMVVSQTETTVTITFDKVAGIPGYMWYTTDKEEFFQANATNFTLHGLYPGQTYNMILRSKSDDGRLSPGYHFNATTAPENVDSFRTVTQTQFSIYLWWLKKAGVPLYILEFSGIEKTIGADYPADFVLYDVQNLHSDTRYTFTLYCEIEGIRSTGVSLTASTSPSRKFESLSENETSITLQWKNNDPQNIYILQFNKMEVNFTSQELGNPAIYTVTGLQNATIYFFTLSTVSNDTLVNQVTISAATAPQNAEGFKPVGQNESSITLSWEPVPGVKSYILQSVHGETFIRGRNEETITNLTSGTFYNFTLFAEFDTVRSSGSSLSAVTVPSCLTAKCKNCKGGYSVCVEWTRPTGVWDNIELTVSDKVFDVGYNGELHAELPNFQPAKKYQASISSRSGPFKSKSYVFICATDARGVIAGAFFGVFLFVLVGAVVFVLLRRSGKISGPKRPLRGGDGTSVRIYHKLT